MSFNSLLEAEIFGEYFSEYDIKGAKEIQKKSIPPFLAGDDLIVLSKTGSGKTLSYLLPIFQKLKVLEKEGRHMEKASPQCVIIVPIKELAHQVSAEAKKISHHAKLRVKSAVGGQKGKRVQSFKSSSFDILVATPGRLHSMLKSKEINFKSLKMLVVDEADQLMDMGFTKDMLAIKSFIKTKVQVAMFSATEPVDFSELSANVFAGHEFSRIHHSASHQTTSNIETFNISLEYTEKKSMLSQFLESEAKGSGVIFTNQKEISEDVYKYAQTISKEKKLKVKTYLIHGDVTEEARRRRMSDFRKTGGILIATDIMARGIDVKGLKWVLNYDLPFEAVYYVHRAGRVGRHGTVGLVYNFVTKKDQKLILKINESIASQTALNISPIAIRTGAGKKASKKVTKKASKKAAKKVAKKTGKKAQRGSKGPQSGKLTKKVTKRRSPRYKRK